MNWDQYFSFLRSSLELPTFNTGNDFQNDSSTLQQLTQPSASKQSLSLLQEFCSNEETTKSCLQAVDQSNNQNNGQQFVHSSKEALNSITENCSSSSNSTQQSENTWIIENLSSTPISSFTSTVSPLTIESSFQSALNNSYYNLESTLFFLVKRGYKLTLSLNTDNREVNEPWNPDVVQKIMSAYFSPLHLRSECLSTEAQLNGFESLLINEASIAFKGQKYLSLFTNLTPKSPVRSPDNLISICNGIKGYRKIETSDKVKLLFNIYYHLNLMESIINYDATIDGWSGSGFKFHRTDAFLFDRYVHDGVVHVIETFPDRLRNDITTIFLIYLIIIFNPDSSDFKYSEMIRYEQYSYIYLLRRYLSKICETDCDASEIHYTLMVEIERVRTLSQRIKEGFTILLDEPLMSTLARAITGQSCF